MAKRLFVNANIEIAFWHALDVEIEKFSFIVRHGLQEIILLIFICIGFSWRNRKMVGGMRAVFKSRD